MKKLLFFGCIIALFSCHRNQDEIESAPNNSELFEKIQLINDNQTNVADISFYDDNNGVICGTFGFMAKTTDGGKTWEKLNVGTNQSFMSTFMLNPTTFYTARLGLYKTSNSGTNFNEIGNLSPIVSSIFDIYFFNNSKGLIAHNAIKKTIDGGNTWQTKYTTDYYYPLTKLEFPSESVGYASGGGTYDSFNVGEIIKTTDGGETWNKILSSINITSISFINNNIGFYSDVNRQLFKTVNGGLNWTKVSALDYYPTDILFTKNEIGYVATLEGKILLTKDGGTTWKIVYDKTSVPITKIVKTTNYIFGVGNDGLLIKAKNNL